MRTRVKICGITRAEDLAVAVAAGADAVGLVFYPASARAVTIQQARELLAQASPFVSTVGLFVNAKAAVVNEAIDELQLDVLQFHGDETADYCAQFSRPWIKALRVKSGLNLLECAAQYSGAKGLLLDADVTGFGGGGRTFDWSLIPPEMPRNFILSGGLTVENVGDAIRTIRPWSVDVSSGVEASDGKSKGIKDAQKIAQFIAAVANADSDLDKETRTHANAGYAL
ncbi:MAG: phosphoribosylanthranilate isomerase [Rhodocyclaceae bacterium]|nr:phosphoribosylanthranilate isomerase [Rhodocyclaceae bacterium]